jgi:hypothetical protein
MSEIISISYDDRAVMAALDRIIRSAADLSPALKSIGETLAASTKARFGGLPRTRGDRPGWRCRCMAYALAPPHTRGLRIPRSFGR